MTELLSPINNPTFNLFYKSVNYAFGLAVWSVDGMYATIYKLSDVYDCILANGCYCISGYTKTTNNLQCY